MYKAHSLRSLNGVAVAAALLILAVAPAEAWKLPAERLAEGKQIGEYIDREFHSPHPYAGKAGSAEPFLAHSQVIYHPGAKYISPFFSRMELAEGDYLIARDPDNLRTWRYERFGKVGLGKGRDAEGFWGTNIPGDVLILELYTTSDRGGWGYSIPYYGRGFSDEEMGIATEAICGDQDMEAALCFAPGGTFEDTAVYDNSRPVARLLIAAALGCTGWLVGCEGHLMTNEHCLMTPGEALATDYEFMAEGPCGTPCSGCPGTVETSQGVLVATSAPLDYTMVQLVNTLSPDINDTYGFMQLRDSGAVVPERIYIPGHPSGRAKDISVFSSHPNEPILDTFAHVASKAEPACQPGGPANEVGYWADTEPGSSGSPVLAYSDHKVVALHHCSQGTDPPCGGGPNRGSRIEEVIADIQFTTGLPACSLCSVVSVPTGVGAAVAGPNQIDVTWDDLGGGLTYTLQRRLGGCADTAGQFQTVATGLTSPSFSDAGVSGGATYSYVVIAEDGGGCQSVRSACTEATATGQCALPPSYVAGVGVASAVNAADSTCRVDVSWREADSNCGGTPVYNVYRSTTPGFTADLSTLVASCRTGTTWSDLGVTTGTKYHYIVRAEDPGALGTGPCTGGFEETNTTEAASTATGPLTDVFADDLEGGTAAWVTAPGPFDTLTTGWSLDGSRTHSGSNAWFVPNETSQDQTVAFAGAVALPSPGPYTLEFWHHYDTEAGWDGGVLEVSALGTAGSWVDILDAEPVTGAPANSLRFLETGYNDTIPATFGNPLSTRSAWMGDAATFRRTVVDLNDYMDNSIFLRWRIGCDASISAPGWWLDDVRIYTAGDCTTGGTNLPPIAGADSDVSLPNSFVDISVLANDSDPDSGPGALSVSSFTQGAHGTVSDNGDGTLKYTPDTNFAGTDSFTYDVSDGMDDATGTVNVLVTSSSCPGPPHFEDQFETEDASQWDRSFNPEGQMTFDGASALVGSFGMAVEIDDNRVHRVVDEFPAGATHMCLSFLLDPNTIAMNEGRRIKVVGGRDDESKNAIGLDMRLRTGQYQLRFRALNDNDKFVKLAFVPVLDEPMLIEMEWIQGTGGNDGEFRMWVNGVLQDERLSFNNDDHSLIEAAIGMMGLWKPGTNGTVYWDLYHSRTVAP